MQIDTSKNKNKESASGNSKVCSKKRQLANDGVDDYYNDDTGDDDDEADDQETTTVQQETIITQTILICTISAGMRSSSPSANRSNDSVHLR